jgi:internalin A
VLPADGPTTSGKHSQAMRHGPTDEDEPAPRAEEAAPFAHIQPAFPPTEGKPKVHVSYSWTDGEKLATSLSTNLGGDFQIVIDRQQMQPCGSILDFMREIGQSKCVLLLLSPKYLESEYCMQELFWLYQSSNESKAIFQAKIIPIVLPGLDIAKAPTRKRCRIYWGNQLQELLALEGEDELKGLPGVLPKDTDEDSRRYRDFYEHAETMLRWASDVLRPQMPASLEPEDLKEIETFIRHQLELNAPANV